MQHLCKRPALAVVHMQGISKQACTEKAPSTASSCVRVWVRGHLRTWQASSPRTILNLHAGSLRCSRRMRPPILDQSSQAKLEPAAQLLVASPLKRTLATWHHTRCRRVLSPLPDQLPISHRRQRVAPCKQSRCSAPPPHSPSAPPGSAHRAPAAECAIHTCLGTNHIIWQTAFLLQSKTQCCTGCTQSAVLFQETVKLYQQ